LPLYNYFSENKIFSKTKFHTNEFLRNKIYVPRRYFRRYTDFFGRSGKVVKDILVTALSEYRNWIIQIEEWQNPILNDNNLPDWYKHALFNELYYLTDGGSLWVGEEVQSNPEMQQKQMEETPLFLSAENVTYENIGKFGLLQSFESLLVNSYNLYFYGSWALLFHFPLLELRLQLDFSDAVFTEDLSEYRTLYSDSRAKRKVRGAIPHDMGNSGDNPWLLINAYCIHDTNLWKDLNTKFVLQIYRDYCVTMDVLFLKRCWPAVVFAMEYLEIFEKDKNGMIENDGNSDYSYDMWPAKGVSAYCGGLWICALSACKQIAFILGDYDAEKKYQKKWEIAKTIYHTKLWSGEYFLFDSSESDHFNTIHADSLCGQWWARACDLPSIANDADIKASLMKIFTFNVEKYQNGLIGPLNGMRPNGQPDTTSTQSNEVWPSVAFGLAATLMQEDMVEEAFSTIRGIIRMIYETSGYMFQTPYAWNCNGYYRELGSMSSLSIWAVQYAWEKGARCVRNDPNRFLFLFTFLLFYFFTFLLFYFFTFLLFYFFTFLLFLLFYFFTFLLFYFFTFYFF
jgi:non-lysosomal glucosylceramidase